MDTSYTKHLKFNGVSGLNKSNELAKLNYLKGGVKNKLVVFLYYGVLPFELIELSISFYLTISFYYYIYLGD